MGSRLPFFASMADGDDSRNGALEQMDQPLGYKAVPAERGQLSSKNQP